MSDGDLVRQTLAGRRTAYEELVRRWAPRITAFCHAKVRRSQAAEDLAQEALMRGYRKLSTLLDPEKFGSWLCGIALRACLDWLKAKERSQVTFGAPEPERSAEQFLHSRPANFDPGRQEELDRLMEEVEKLPDNFREVLMLYYYQDVTYADIAGMLGVSRATINARLTKARAMLRERLSRSKS